MATITVTSLDDTVAVDGVVTLREAIEAANSDTAVGDAPAGSGADAIVFAAGLAGGTIILASALTISSAIHIVGDDITVARASAPLFNVVSSGASGVVFSSLTMTGGHAITVFGGAKVTVDNSTISGGIDKLGGGIRSSGDLTVINSTLTGNAASYFGGAISADGGTVTVIGSTFSSNTAGLGGAAISTEGAAVLTVINSTFAGNTTDGEGAAIFNSGGGATIVNSTISLNSGDSAVYLEGAIAGISNTMIAKNTGGPDLNGDGSSLYTTGGGNFIGDGNGQMNDGTLGDRVGTDLAPLDPLLGPLANNGGPVQTMAPAANSPLIDGGRNAALPLDVYDIDRDVNTTETLPIDGRGGARTLNGTVDIGALEFVPATAPTTADNTVSTIEDTSYTFALADFAFDDDDGDSFTAVTIATLPTSGTLELDGVALTGTTSVAIADISAGKLVYVPAADANGTGAGSFTFKVEDDGDTANGGVVVSAAHTMTIDIAAVNDAPTLSAPAVLAATEDQPVTLTGISFSDVDAGNGQVAAAVWAATGTLSALSGGGVIVSGSGYGNMALVGTIADINAFLAAGGVTYNPNANANGDVVLNIAFSDEGFTGTGRVETATGQTTLAIAAVDDAPVLTLTQVLSSLKESASTSSARKVADIAITDIDGGSNPLSLSGADKNLFVISNGDLYLKAGAKLDFEENPVLDVTVHAGAASAGLKLKLTDVIEKIVGDSRNNHLTGTAGGETIDGRKGNDTINGRGGDDTIIGGAGADRLTGGGGADTFVFKPGDLPKVGFFDQWLSPLNGKYDLITDFKPGTDVIDLSALDANSRKHGNQAFHFKGEGERLEARGDLVTELYGNKPSARHTIIMGDTNGDGNYDFKIVLKGHHHLDADDFIL